MKGRCPVKRVPEIPVPTAEVRGQSPRPGRRESGPEDRASAHGRAAETPVAVVSWGSYSRQRTVEGTLADIVRRCEDAAMEAPAVTVVGEVAALRERLRWFANRPLFGRRIIVTRPREQSAELVQRIEAEGGEALVAPSAMVRVVLEAQQQVTTPVTQRRSAGLMGVLAIWLGLSQAAFDFTIDYVKQRHGFLAGAQSILGTPPGYRSEQAWAQFGIGHMEHWLETGRTILYDTARRLDDTFASPQEFTRLMIRTVYHLRRMGEEVAQGAMKVCGAHAYVRNRPLERIFRDLVGGNVMAWKTDELLLGLGQGALGMPVTITGPGGS